MALSPPTYAGTLVTSTVSFTDPNGNPIDPTGVELQFQITSSGPITTWYYQGSGSVTRLSTGVYSAPIDTTDAINLNGATVTVKWIGTGACQVTEVATFPVVAPPF